MGLVHRSISFCVRRSPPTTATSLQRRSLTRRACPSARSGVRRLTLCQERERPDWQQHLLPLNQATLAWTINPVWQLQCGREAASLVRLKRPTLNRLLKTRFLSRNGATRAAFAGKTHRAGRLVPFRDFLHQPVNGAVTFISWPPSTVHRQGERRDSRS